MEKRVGWAFLVAFLALALACPDDEDEGWVEASDGGFYVRVRAAKTTLQVGETTDVFAEVGFEIPDDLITEAEPGQPMMSADWGGSYSGKVELVEGTATHSTPISLTLPDPGMRPPVREATQKVTCRAEGTGKISVYIIGYHFRRSGERVDGGAKVDIDFTCEGTSGDAALPHVYLNTVPAGTGADDLIPTIALVPRVSDDGMVWNAGAELVFTIGGQQVDIPDQGLGGVGTLVEQWTALTEADLDAWCGLSTGKDAMPSAHLVESCAALQALFDGLGGGGGPDGGMTNGDGVLVDPCTLFEPSDIAPVIGNAVIEISGWNDDERGGTCSYDPDTTSTIQYAAGFNVRRFPATRATLDTYFFISSGYGSGFNDYTVINDADGLLDDLIAAGTVQAGNETQSITQGTADPALGSLTVMQGGLEYTTITTFVDGYDINIEISVNVQIGEGDSWPDRAAHQQAVVTLARAVYADYVAAQQ